MSSAMSRGDDGHEPLDLVLRALAGGCAVHLLAVGQDGIETASFDCSQADKLTDWYRSRERAAMIYLTMNSTRSAPVTTGLAPLEVVYDLCKVLMKGPRSVTATENRKASPVRGGPFTPDLTKWWTQKLSSGEILPGAGWPGWVHKDLLLQDLRRVKLSATSQLLRKLLEHASAGEAYLTQLWAPAELPDRRGATRTVRRPYVINLPTLDRCKETWLQVASRVDPR